MLFVEFRAGARVEISSLGGRMADRLIDRQAGEEANERRGESQK